MRVLLVDDDECVLRSWRRSLEHMKVEVLAASSFEDTEQLLRNAPPNYIDIAIIDLILVGRNGLDVGQLIGKICPRASLVLVSAYLDAQAGLAAHELRMLPINKPLDVSTLTGLVRFFRRDTEEKISIKRVFPMLSKRETEVVRYAVAGLENKVIASTVGIKSSTVETYWRRIYVKTGLRSQREVLAAVIRAV